MSKPKIIKTDQRIFEVTNSEGETYLCNLKHFKLDNKGNLIGANKEPLVRVRHYWNNTFKKIGKLHVKEMILANRKTTIKPLDYVELAQRETHKTD